MPETHAALCRTVGSRRVLLRIDGERVLLRNLEQRLVLTAHDDGADVEFDADGRTLLKLTAGELSFVDAALENRILVRAPVEDFLVFYEALLLYVHAAVRSPSLPALLAEFAETRGGWRHG